MPVSINIRTPLTQAEKDEIAADAASQVTATSGVNDLGSLSADPITPADGNYWYNSTEEQFKIKTPVGVAILEQGSDEWTNIQW